MIAPTTSVSGLHHNRLSWLGFFRVLDSILQDCKDSSVDESSGEKRSVRKDCPFRTDCPVFRNAFISEGTKASRGRGCGGQTDSYRSDHCKAFRCQTLVRALREASATPSAG